VGWTAINIKDGVMGQWVPPSIFYTASPTKVTLVNDPTQSDTVEIEGQVYRLKCVLSVSRLSKAH